MDNEGKGTGKYIVHRTEVVIVQAISAEEAVRKSVWNVDRYNGEDSTDVKVQKYMCNVDEVREYEY